MSGAFDLTVIISGRTLKKVAQDLWGALYPTLEDVTGNFATILSCTEYRGEKPDL